MKKCKAAALCLSAVFLLSACGKEPASSAVQSSSEPEPASFAAPPALSAPPAVSEPAASEPETPESAPPQIQLDATPSFISLPVTAPGGSEGEKALLVLRVPESWSFDQYTTFSRGEIKIAEFPRLWQVAEGAVSPFSTEMMAPYQNDEMSPEGADPATAEDLELNGNRLRVLHLRTWLDGSEEPWFLHCAFYALDGYVVEVHLYSQQEWGGADSDELLSALGTLELHFSGEDGGEA